MILRVLSELPTTALSEWERAREEGGREERRGEGGGGREEGRERGGGYSVTIALCMFFSEMITHESSPGSTCSIMFADN